MEYVSVSQYAQMVGKDPGNIRRMLINGTLAGEKIGNQWVLPKDTVFPADRRVKSGKYRNWRKRSGHTIDGQLMDRLAALSSSIGEVYGQQLTQIVLYGSYARGSQTAESDVDIALFLDGQDSEYLHDEMTDLVVDYELELGITLSVVTIDNEQFRQWKDTLPYFQNIHREGIELWKAA